MCSCEGEHSISWKWLTGHSESPLFSTGRNFFQKVARKRASTYTGTQGLAFLTDFSSQIFFLRQAGRACRSAETLGFYNLVSLFVTRTSNSTHNNVPHGLGRKPQLERAKKSNLYWFTESWPGSVIPGSSYSTPLPLFPLPILNNFFFCLPT